MYCRILRKNMISVFQKYVHFSILELGDAVIMCEYELRGSSCKFITVCKQQFFVWAEKLHEQLKESFREL